VKPRTTPQRVILAILAGALAGPLFVVLIAQLSDPGAWTLVATGQFLTSLPLVAPLSVLIGGPVALASIVILLGPLWIAHHRSGGGARTFILAGAAAGLVMALPLALIGGGSLAGGVRLLLTFTVAAIPTSAILWIVAYGRPRKPMAAEPSAPATP
jgi:hypothetical protein